MGKVVEINAQRRKRRRWWPWILLLAVAAIAAFLNSPFFRVEKPEIEGNERVPDAIVMENLGMTENMNLFRYFITNVNKEHEFDPLILSAEVFVHWPRNVRVVVTEKKVMGYIPYMGMYLCVDTTGSVLDSVHEVADGMPVLSGVDVKSFALGAPVDTEDTERFTIMLDCLKVLEKYGLLAKVDKISVARSNDIHLLMEEEQLDVSLGEAEGLDRKISAVVSILEDPERPPGVLHLEDLDGQVYIERSD